MRTYDLVFIVSPSVTEPARKKLLETVKGWLKGVTIAKEEDMGSKALKYAIRHELTGHYFALSLEAEESIPADVEKKLFAEENILRHLLIRTK